MSRSCNSKQQLLLKVSNPLLLSMLKIQNLHTKCTFCTYIVFCPVILVSPFTNDMAGGLTLIETLDVGDCQLVSLCLTHSVRGDIDCISK